MTLLQWAAEKISKGEMEVKWDNKTLHAGVKPALLFWSNHGENFAV